MNETPYIFSASREDFIYGYTDAFPDPSVWEKNQYGATNSFCPGKTPDWQCSMSRGHVGAHVGMSQGLGSRIFVVGRWFDHNYVHMIAEEEEPW